ncbi:MAG: NADP-dependent oxidoreductase [Planctomycetaceae bacterium]|mgnify:CR=1 FL=1|jgi:aryl-alcohol dehydrogenase-like predicted oxidoreductase|nr:NADP-dependent oxidoreductase [Planctomycetaceae bacterium]
MDYRLLGRTGIRVSEICLGTMMFGGRTDEADSQAIIARAIDAGVNFLDTADIYNAGASEEIVGRGIAACRDRVILATKGRNAMGEGPNDSGTSRGYLMRALDASLKRMGTDYVDVYYVHSPDYDTPLDETLRALDDMVRSGRVRYVACSNYRGWYLAKALSISSQHELERFACVQPLYNIVNRDIEVDLLPLCQDQQIGVVSYSGLARGILTGKYTKFGEYPEGSRASLNDPRMTQAELREASIAVSQRLVGYCQERGTVCSQFSLAWCLANPILTSVIVGPRTMEQFEDNLGCLDVEWTDADEELVDSLVPPGEHSGFGFQDSAYPVTGRGR